MNPRRVGAAMHKPLVLVALLSLTALAGCLDDGDAGDPVDAAGCARTAFEHPGVRFLNTTDDPIVDDQDLAFDFETYNVRTCSLAAVGWTPLRWDDAGDPDPHGYIGEIDMRGDLDLGAVAVLGLAPESPRVYLLDISDRARPEVLSTIAQTGTYLVDVKISDDGRYLFTASQSLPGPGEAGELLALSPTADVGFTVYDISDPAAPVWVNTFVEPGGDGCHMMSHEIVQGVDTISCIAQNVRVYGLDRVGGRLLTRGFVDYHPGGVPVPSGLGPAGDPTCSLPSEAPDPGVCALTEGPHDVTVQVDEQTGQVLAVVSHWGEGVRVVDLTDAPQATELGAWTGEGATHYAGNVHTAMMFYAGGTRYVLASPEYTSQVEAVPSLWLLDATDLGDLRLVGEWYHPNEHPSQGLFLTTHQWQVAPTGADVPLSDVHVYLTMNHGGLWVLGLEQILAGDRAGAVEGFHLSRTPLDTDSLITGNARLNTWDVNVVDGTIYGSDRATGLWIFDFDGDRNEAATTGFA